MADKLSMIYTTLESEAQVTDLAAQALAIQLAACVNVFPQARSYYIWQGQMESSHEWMALFKTCTPEKLRDWLVQNHPYEVPFVATLEFSDINAPFLAWALKNQGSSV